MAGQYNNEILSQTGQRNELVRTIKHIAFAGAAALALFAAGKPLTRPEPPLATGKMISAQKAPVSDVAGDRPETLRRLLGIDPPAP